MRNKYLYIIVLFFTIVLGCKSAYSKQFVLVIDAGHGGKDYGAIGNFSREKDINLSVALAFGKLVKEKMKGVKVVYTRDKDVYLTLQGRADVANSCKGDLFVSIHTNSVAKESKNRTRVKGSATYTLGLHKTEANLEVAKRENSVITLENDYTTRYEGFDPNSTESYIIFELNQGKHVSQSLDFASNVQEEFTHTAGRVNNGVRQAGFWVLARTGMPSVLVELDFICNPEQETFMNSKKGQKLFAKSLYNALAKYLKSNGYGDYTPEAKDVDEEDDVKEETYKSESLDKEIKEQHETVKEPIPNTTQDSENSVVSYKIQLLTSTKILTSNSSEFKGLSPVSYYKDKGLYKYTYFETSDIKRANEELKKIRSKFSKAFIVAFKNGKRFNNRK